MKSGPVGVDGGPTPGRLGRSVPDSFLPRVAGRPLARTLARFSRSGLVVGLPSRGAEIRPPGGTG